MRYRVPEWSVIARKALFLASMAAVLWFIVRHLREIGEYSFHFNPLFLALSILFALLGHLANFTVWNMLSASFGIRVPILTAGRAWFLSRLGRYIPGKVPFLLYRISVYKQFPGRVITLATAVEYIASVAAACIIVLVSIVDNSAMIPAPMRWTAAIGSILFLGLLWPSILDPVVNRIFRLFKKAPVEKLPSYRVIMLTVGGYFVAALIHGLGFFMLLRSLTDIPFSCYLPITGVYFAAGLVGLAAIFAPSGIGVLEGFMFLILPQFIPEPVAIVGTLGARIVVTVTELFLVGLFLVPGSGRTQKGARGCVPPGN